jgi:hypothetical protein
VAAKAYAEATSAKYIHFGPLSRIDKGLGRIYVEAMLPALLGYQDLVFDRSWLSDLPYGVAFREGKDRLGVAGKRMLERLALRCGAVVVLCQPSWETVRSNYAKRKHLEMLENEDQLRLVYDLYAKQRTDLPFMLHNYELGKLQHEKLDDRRYTSHPLDLASAGCWEAPTVLVGEAFGEPKDQDALYQWPFASFSNEGCSRWLTLQLAEAGVSEDQLLWLNADQNLSLLHELDVGQIIALGQKAQAELYKHKILAMTVPHPQAFKRFNAHERYPLLDLLKEPE